MEQEHENHKISYEALWKFIIRPPREIYDEKQLGSSIFSYKGKNYLRKDYDIVSSEGYIMKCSFFEPENLFRPKKIMPVVLYLHGNASSRIEGVRQIKELLKLDINLFVVDLPGCGLSEGEYVSLGYHESHDVKILVDFIENLPGVGNIGLWGRSMGAATTMLYAHKDERIKAIVMDSPFADFNLLAKQIVLKQIKLPNFLIEGALKIIKMTVKKKNGLDIDRLKPIEVAPKTTQPAIFIHANDDELIDNKHSEMLKNAYGGKDKSLKNCPGKHNSIRPPKIIRDIAAFFYKHLVNDSEEDNTSTIANKSDIFDMDGNSEDLKADNIIKENDEHNIENKQNNNEIKNNNNSQNDDDISDIEEYSTKIAEKSKKEDETEFLPKKMSDLFHESEKENEKQYIDNSDDIDENIV